MWSNIRARVRTSGCCWFECIARGSWEEPASAPYPLTRCEPVTPLACARGDPDGLLLRGRAPARTPPNSPPQISGATAHARRCADALTLAVARQVTEWSVTVRRPVACVSAPGDAYGDSVGSGRGLRRSAPLA